MNLTSRVRRAVVVAALASTIAARCRRCRRRPSRRQRSTGPALHRGATRTAHRRVAARLHGRRRFRPDAPATGGGPSTDPTPPPPAEDPSTSNPTPPAPPEPTVAPTTTNPPPAPEPIPPTTAPPVATQPPPAPPKTTQPQNAIATTTTTPNAVPVTVAAMAATAPQSLVATPGNATVKLTWKAPASNGGAHDRQVRRAALQQRRGGPTIASRPASATRSHRTNGTKYSFRIAAHNTAGWGPPAPSSPPCPAPCPAHPSPVATPGNGSVKLTWGPGVQRWGDGLQVRRAALQQRPVDQRRLPHRPRLHGQQPGQRHQVLRSASAPTTPPDGARSAPPSTPCPTPSCRARHCHRWRRRATAPSS